MLKILSINVDPNLTPRQQVRAAIDGVPVIFCQYHRTIPLEVDLPSSLRAFSEFPDGTQIRSSADPGIFEVAARPWNANLRHQRIFRASFRRCVTCWRLGEASSGQSAQIILPSPCPADSLNPWTPAERLFSVEAKVPIAIDRAPTEHLRYWATNLIRNSCHIQGETTPLLPESFEQISAPDTYLVPIIRLDCPQCWLERTGIPPNEASASFDNFIIDAPAMREHFELCRKFAANPVGTLVMLGDSGNGKTHLAYAIMREWFRRGHTHAHFITYRDFLNRYRHDQRPCAFGEEPATTNLTRCQSAGLLVLDDVDNTLVPGTEGALLDLFNYRFGHGKPTVITSNLSYDDFKSTVGSRLTDRFQMTSFALLLFGFPSRRASLNDAYLKRWKR